MVLAPCCTEATDRAGEELTGVTRRICTGNKALPAGEGHFRWLKNPTTGFKHKHTVISLRCVSWVLLFLRAVLQFLQQFCRRGVSGDEASVVTLRADVPLVTLLWLLYAVVRIQPNKKDWEGSWRDLGQRPWSALNEEKPWCCRVCRAPARVSEQPDTGKLVLKLCLPGSRGR